MAELRPVYYDLTNNGLKIPNDSDTIISSPDIILSTIADLKAYDIESNLATKTIQVLGRNTAGDGGGNLFYWDSTNTATQNNSKYYDYTVIKPDSILETDAGRWVRKSDKPRVTLQEFGVVPYDSSIDSSSALNKIFPLDDPSNTFSIEASNLFVNGRYFIEPNQFIIPKFQSSSIVGRSTGFTSYFRPFTNTSGWLIYIGDSTASVSGQDSLLRDIGLDLRHPDSTDSVDRVADLTGILLRYQNILNFDNIDVRNIGAGGIGIESLPDDGLMQELYFRRLQFNSGDSGGFSSGSYGFYMFPTGNIELHQCNLESVETAIYMRYQRHEVLSVDQCYIERVLRLLDVDNCEVKMKSSASQGNIWLGNSVYGSDIDLTQNATSENAQYRGVNVSDNGIGNKIIINSSAGRNEKDLFYAGINFDGTEWLKSGLVNSDPLFKEGSTSWSNNNTTKQTRVFNIKNMDGGLAMLVTATSPDGYVEHVQEVNPAKEHLVQVGIVFNSGNDNNVRVELYDSTDTLIHNSGTIDFDGLNTRTGHNLKIYRKWVPAQAGGEIKVRIVIEDNGGTVLCPFFAINESEITVADIKNSGGSYTVNNSGTATQSFTKTLRSGEKLYFDNSTNNDRKSKYLVRFKADASAFFGAENDYNNNFSWSHYNLYGEEREYVMLIPAGAADYWIYWFGSDKEITVSDISVHKADAGDDTFVDEITFQSGINNEGNYKQTGYTLSENNAMFLGNIGTNNNFTFATGDVNTTADTITEVAHGLSTNDAVQITSSGSIPSGLVADTMYVIKIDDDTFQLATERDGSAVDITDVGSGTHTLRNISVPFTIKLPDSFCGALLKLYCYANSGTFAETTVWIRREGSGTANIDSAINEVYDDMSLNVTLNELDEENVDVELTCGTSNQFTYLWYDIKTFSGSNLEIR